MYVITTTSGNYGPVQRKERMHHRQVLTLMSSWLNKVALRFVKTAWRRYHQMARVRIDGELTRWSGGYAATTVSIYIF